MVRHYKQIYTTRMRCASCGHIPNDSRRFEWDHKFQTFEIEFGARRGQTGRGGIRYTEIENPEYIPIMRAMVKRLAPRLGLSVTDDQAGGGAAGTRRRRRGP